MCALKEFIILLFVCVWKIRETSYAHLCLRERIWQLEKFSCPWHFAENLLHLYSNEHFFALPGNQGRDSPIFKNDF
jgi:hypothetical protein